MTRNFYLISLLATIMLHSCAPDEVPSDIDNPFGQLPQDVLDPADNASSPEKVILGKLLFWDPILSGNKDIACVTCHHPSNGYAEQIDLSLGVGGLGLSEQRAGGTLVKRNAPTIINTAFNGLTENGNISPENAPMFWDNRVVSLESQAIGPLLSGDEVRGTGIPEEAILDTIILRLESIPEYRERFTDVFGGGNISEEMIGKAIACFERTLISKNSRFDQFAAGDETILTQEELRGIVSFSESGCDNCHSGPMFSDFELHVLSVSENQKLDDPDNGDGNFAFRTPSLRNLRFTAPYMHNGTLNSLDDVLDFYDDADDGSQNNNVRDRQLDPELRRLDVEDEDAIIAFLNTLNDNNFDKEIPQTVPSKLNPGGNIK